MRLVFTVRARALGCFRQSYQYRNLSEGADRVGGQLRGDTEECPFSGVTVNLAEFGGMCRKVVLGVLVLTR